MYMYLASLRIQKIDYESVSGVSCGQGLGLASGARDLAHVEEGFVRSVLRTRLTGPRNEAESRSADKVA